MSAAVPRVSIVTVCRNAAATIGRCLDAVAAQDWPDLEHVVQDGASTDGTLGLLAAHGRRVDLQLVSVPDGGQNDAFVRAVARCTGDIVGFSWADETLLPGAVAWAVETFAARPWLGAVYGDFIEVDVDGRELRTRCYPDWNFANAFAWQCLPPVCSAFVRREALVDCFLPMARLAPACTEYVLWVTVGAHWPVRHVSRPVASYTCHAHQLSRCVENVDAYPDQLIEAMAQLADALPLPQAVRDRRREARANVHLWAAHELAVGGAPREIARRHLLTALAIDATAHQTAHYAFCGAEALVIAGDGAEAITWLAAVEAHGVTVPGADFLRACALASHGATAAADAAWRALLRDPHGPLAARSMARVAAGLMEGGRNVEAEAVLVALARAAATMPRWRLPLAVVLANLYRVEEAHRVLASHLAAAPDDRSASRFAAQLELAIAMERDTVREQLGALADRAPLERAEARGIAAELAILLDGSPRDVAPEGLHAVIAVLEDEAVRSGFGALHRGLLLIGARAVEAGCGSHP